MLLPSYRGDGQYRRLKDYLGSTVISGRGITNRLARSGSKAQGYGFESGINHLLIAFSPIGIALLGGLSCIKLSESSTAIAAFSPAQCSRGRQGDAEACPAVIHLVEQTMPQVFR